MERLQDINFSSQISNFWASSEGTPEKDPSFLGTLSLLHVGVGSDTVGLEMGADAVGVKMGADTMGVCVCVEMMGERVCADTVDVCADTVGVGANTVEEIHIFSKIFNF